MKVLQILIVILVIFVVGTGAFMTGFGVHYFQTANSKPADSQVPAKFPLMWEAYKMLKSDFYGKFPEPQTLVHGMIRGMLASLGDSHTVLVEPQSAQIEQNTLQGSYGGIGAQIELKDGAFVLLPYPDGPAARAGIQANDMLIKIDKTELAPNMSTQDVEVKLRGDVGSKVTLTIHRVGDAESFRPVDVTREKINIPTVLSRMIDNTNFGYIQVTLESAETAKQFADALTALKAKNLKGLVIDLRNNPGGLFPDPVLDISGQFLKNNEPVVIEKYRDGTEKEYKAGSGRLATDLPIAVLVNGGTASAAEVLAGALSDLGRGPLIGEKTFGKGSVQQVNALSDKSSLHITIATWLTPKKNTIDGTGLQPTIAVPWTAESKAKGVDTQLQRAIDYLQNGK